MRVGRSPWDHTFHSPRRRARVGRGSWNDSFHSARRRARVGRDPWDDTFYSPRRRARVGRGPWEHIFGGTVILHEHISADARLFPLIFWCAGVGRLRRRAGFTSSPAATCCQASEGWRGHCARSAWGRWSSRTSARKWLLHPRR